MAGAGVKLFTAGSILTASDVNTYLMDQTVSRFADAAARDAAFGGVGEPLLSEGRICYLDSDNTLYIYTGSAWVEVQSGITGTAGQVVVYDGSGDPIAQTLTGDVTVNSSGVTAISSGVIVNADVNASAAIALSKLASGTAGQLVVHNASGVPTATTVTGDVTITSSGVTAISSGAIVNADINASAAIAYSKLDVSNSITTTDLASGAPRAGFRSTRNAQTGTTYTLALTDLGALVELNNANPITLTVPAEATVAFSVGDRIDILQTGAGQVTIAGATSPTTVTVNGYDGGLKLNGQWAAATLIKRATNTWVVIGNITV